MTRKRGASDSFPGDLAARELSRLAEALSEDANRAPGGRRMIGHSGDALRLAARALDVLATGGELRTRDRKPSGLISWKKKSMPMLRAVEAVEDAAHAGAESWTEAIDAAAAALGLDPRTIERHLARYLDERGMTRDDYLLFAPK